MDAQREAVAVEDVEHVEDVAGAAHEAEHPRDAHCVARPRVRQQLAELRPLGGEAAGGAAVLLEDGRVLDSASPGRGPGRRSTAVPSKPACAPDSPPRGPSVRRIGPYLSSNDRLTTGGRRVR